MINQTVSQLKTRLAFGLGLGLFVLTGLVASGCGDYEPCHTLALRICTECPNVSQHWQAACRCAERDTLKELGYLCRKPTKADKNRCDLTLDNWNENSCDELNQ